MQPGSDGVAACDTPDGAVTSPVDALENLVNSTIRFSLGFGLNVAPDMPTSFIARGQNSTGNLEQADAVLRAHLSSMRKTTVT